MSTRQQDLVQVDKKKKERTSQIADLAIPADHRVKPKESEKEIST